MKIILFSVNAGKLELDLGSLGMAGVARGDGGDGVHWNCVRYYRPPAEVPTVFSRRSSRSIAATKLSHLDAGAERR